LNAFLANRLEGTDPTKLKSGDGKGLPVDAKPLSAVNFDEQTEKLVPVRFEMASSGMLRRVALVRTDVSEELSASFIRMLRIAELVTTLAVTSNRRALLCL
jgi:hypothetical protein